MTKPSRNLLREHPAEHLIRLRVWTPDKFRGQTHRSMQVEGPVPKWVAELFEALALNCDEADQKEFERLTRKLTRGRK